MILCIVQARVSSTRLPGKVLKQLLGEPMLMRQLERLRDCRLIDHVLVATSVDASDDKLEEFCRTRHVDCFRGSLEDVLDRFYHAACLYSPEYIVRITGDCPIIDPEITDEVIKLCRSGDFDYACNNLEPSYPDGLDAEAMRTSALARAWSEARLPSHREHVTRYICRNPSLFRIGQLYCDNDLSHLRWTVDEPVDYEVITHIFEGLYPQNPHFRMADVLAFLESYPEWKTANIHHRRNEGLQKSLQKDEEFLRTGRSNV